MVHTVFNPDTTPNNTLRQATPEISELSPDERLGSSPNYIRFLCRDNIAKSEQYLHLTQVVGLSHQEAFEK